MAQLKSDDFELRELQNSILEIHCEASEERSQKQLACGHIDTKIEHELYESIIYQLETKKVFLDPKINLIKFSSMVGTNTTYLSNIVNQRFGVNFKTLINRYRVAQAKELLSKRECTLEELITLCGFSSRSILYTAFQREVGVPPSHYRSEVLHIRPKN